MATVILPTTVCAVPAATVTAPDDDPKLMRFQSKEPPFGNPPLRIPASISVPVGNVIVTAEALVTVIIRVSSLAIVVVLEAVSAVGAGWAMYALVSIITFVNVACAGVVSPIVPGAANVAPLSELAFKLATFVVEATTNGAVPVANVDVI